MIKYFENHPSKKINCLLLIIGLIIFIPIYCVNYAATFKIFEPEVFTKLFTSFDTNYFKAILQSVDQKGQLNLLFKVYLLNIVSMTGFALSFFSLTIIIARSGRNDSKIYKLSFLFPVIVIIIALLDILSSIVILILIKNINFISDYTTYFINGAYISRIILCYVIFLWIIIMGILFIVKGFRKNNKQKHAL